MQEGNKNNEVSKIPEGPVNLNSKSSLEDIAVGKNSKKSLFFLILITVLAGLTMVLPLVGIAVILFYFFIQGLIAGGLETQAGGFILAGVVVFIPIVTVAAFAFVGLIKFIQNKMRGKPISTGNKVALIVVLLYFIGSFIPFALINIVPTMSTISYHIRGGPSQSQLEQVEITNGTIDELKTLLDSCHVASMTTGVFDNYGPFEPKNMFLVIITTQNSEEDPSPPVKNLTLPFSEKTKAENLIVEKNKKLDGPYKNCSELISIESPVD